MQGLGLKHRLPTTTEKTGGTDEGLSSWFWKRVDKPQGLMAIVHLAELVSSRSCERPHLRTKREKEIEEDSNIDLKLWPLHLVLHMLTCEHVHTYLSVCLLSPTATKSFTNVLSCLSPNSPGGCGHKMHNWNELSGWRLGLGRWSQNLSCCIFVRNVQGASYTLLYLIFPTQGLFLSPTLQGHKQRPWEFMQLASWLW